MNKYPNNKTYEDLLKEHDNGWEVGPFLEEFIFDADTLLEEVYNKNRFGDILPGDIIMANNGKSDREAGMDILTPHRVFVVETINGEPGKRIFKGYLISSNVAKANKNNKHFHNNIYINNYASIIERGPKFDLENFINLSDLYTIEEEKISLDSTLWKGRTTKEFQDFIAKTVEKITNGENVENIYWIK